MVSQRPNAPQFALVDGSNQVVSFVTPAPGVNLQQYVGKEIGISGERGYIPDLQKPHVTAQRINVIDGTTLRLALAPGSARGSPNTSIRQMPNEVRLRGLEPPRPFGHKLLRLARLPVPPQPLISGDKLGRSF